MTDEARFISFRERRLAEASVRLDLISDHEGWFAVSKPSGMLLLSDPWEAGTLDLVSALRTEIKSGKKQMATFGILAPSAINRLDIDESGVAILAKNEDAGTALKNLLGSSGLKMTYELLVEAPVGASIVECSLPLSRHREQPRVVVSHRSGKIASTTFRRVESFGFVSRWEAETSYSRIHQIRIHAAESGLGILGERLYQSVPPIYLSRLKKRYRRSGKPERPIYDHIAVHLKRIEVRFPEEAAIQIDAPLPRGYAALIRRLREYAI